MRVVFPPQAASGGGGGGGALPAGGSKSELEEANRKVYALMSQVAGLEEELDQYRTYMKTTVGRYQAKLKEHGISL